MIALQWLFITKCYCLYSIKNSAAKKMLNLQHVICRNCIIAIIAIWHVIKNWVKKEMVTDRDRSDVICSEWCWAEYWTKCLWSAFELAGCNAPYAGWSQPNRLSTFSPRDLLETQSVWCVATDRSRQTSTSSEQRPHPGHCLDRELLSRLQQRRTARLVSLHNHSMYAAARPATLLLH